MTHPDALKIRFTLHWIGGYGDTAIERHEGLYHWQNRDAAFACTALEAIENSDPDAIPLPSEFLLTYAYAATVVRHWANDPSYFQRKDFPPQPDPVKPVRVQHRLYRAVDKISGKLWSRKGVDKGKAAGKSSEKKNGGKKREAFLEVAGSDMGDEDDILFGLSFINPAIRDRHELALAEGQQKICQWHETINSDVLDLNVGGDDMSGSGHSTDV